MFGISGEHLLILLVVLLFFGPRRLPELGNSLGRTLKNFKDAMAGNDNGSAPAPMAKPVEPTPTASIAASASAEEKVGATVDRNTKS